MAGNTLARYDLTITEAQERSDKELGKLLNFGKQCVHMLRNNPHLIRSSQQQKEDSQQLRQTNPEPIRSHTTLLVSEARDAIVTGRAREIRLAAHLHQTEIASVLGVTVSAVCKWERGQRLPRGDVAADYARLLRQLEDTKRERTA